MASHVGLHSVESNVVGDVANCVEDVANASGGASDVVEVFAVSPGLVEPDLVEACAASEDEFLAQERMVGDLDDES